MVKNLEEFPLSLEVNSFVCTLRLMLESMCMPVRILGCAFLKKRHPFGFFGTVGLSAEEKFLQQNSPPSPSISNFV